MKTFRGAPCGLDKEKQLALDAFIGSLETTDGALIQVLHKAQSIFGYLPKELQLDIARKLGISGAKVFGVVSFYSFFTMEPPGKHTISVCMGTACFVRGADKVLAKVKEVLGIENNETTADGHFSLKDVRCVGACGLAPVVMIDGKVFGKVTADQVESILEPYYKD